MKSIRHRCAVLSCYLVLKGWSLMGDAIAHAVLPDSMARTATAGKAAAGSARLVPDEKAAR